MTRTVDAPNRFPRPQFPRLRWGLALFAACLWLATQPPASAAETFSAKQRQEIETVVSDYLKRNPQILLEMSAALEARENEKKLVQNRETLEQDPNSVVGGNPNGDITVVEFFDYRCSFCKEMTERLHQTVTQDGKVRLIYKEFPILGPDSIFAARAAIAAIPQGREKYIALHKALLAVRGPLSEAVVLATAKQVGLDVAKMQARIPDKTVESVISENLKLARGMGINGTPAFVIGDRIIEGAIDTAGLKQAIAEARSGCMTC